MTFFFCILHLLRHDEPNVNTSLSYSMGWIAVGLAVSKLQGRTELRSLPPSVSPRSPPCSPPGAALHDAPFLPSEVEHTGRNAAPRTRIPSLHRLKKLKARKVANF